MDFRKSGKVYEQIRQSGASKRGLRGSKYGAASEVRKVEVTPELRERYERWTSAGTAPTQTGDTRPAKTR